MAGKGSIKQSPVRRASVDSLIVGSGPYAAADRDEGGEQHVGSQDEVDHVVHRLLDCRQLGRCLEQRRRILQ